MVTVKKVVVVALKDGLRHDRPRWATGARVRGIRRLRIFTRKVHSELMKVSNSKQRNSWADKSFYKDYKININPSSNAFSHRLHRLCVSYS